MRRMVLDDFFFQEKDRRKDFFALHFSICFETALSVYNLYFFSYGTGNFFLGFRKLPFFKQNKQRKFEGGESFFRS